MLKDPHVNVKLTLVGHLLKSRNMPLLLLILLRLRIYLLNSRVFKHVKDPART